MQKVILASQSNARKELFSSLGIPFKTIPAKINEKAIRNKNLKIRAERLARAKAELIVSKHNAIVIGADTFDCIGNDVMEKPKDKKEAVKMLKALSGNDAEVYTGLCYIDRENGIDYSTSIKVTYKFRKLYDKEINEYVKKFPVTEWAAGFALVFPYVNTFIASINGSLTGLAYGLPTELLIPLLKKSGFEPNPTK
jgi:septum formation protein